MLRALLICGNESTCQEISASLHRIPELELARAMSQHPSPDELLRMIRVHHVNMVLLDVDDFDQARVLAKSLDHLAPGLPVVTFGKQDAIELLPQLLHLGVRDHLSLPADAAALAGSVESVRRQLHSRPLPNPRPADLYTFLPARPGVGTSTIALSTSCALAEDLNVRTLLMDCDLAAGVLQFLLKLGHSASVADAVNHSGNLDEGLWSQMVGHRGKLEVLHAGRLDSPERIDLAGLAQVLGAARAQYELICADLASSIDAFSVALMKESRRIFLVTTPEVVSLHMASLRVQRLKELGLDERVSLLLNRRGPSDIEDADVAAAVGRPVAYRFSNDYTGVQNSIMDAAPVESESDLGRSILNLAHSLAPQAEIKLTQAQPRHKFLQFFRTHRVDDSYLPMRD